MACLGVTVGDWRLLALAAAQNMALEVAHKALVRTKDMPFIELLASIKQRREQQMLLDKHDAINAKVRACVGASVVIVPASVDAWMKKMKATRPSFL